MSLSSVSTSLSTLGPRTDNQGMASSPYVPSTPAFADPRHHVDGRYSSGSGGSTQGQANGTGNGPYDHPGYPHGPPPHVIPRNGVMYPNGTPNGGGDYRENESWNVSQVPSCSGIELTSQNGPPPFTPQNPYGVYPDGAYNGTPNHHQAHEFSDPQGQGQGQGQTTPHAYEAPVQTHSKSNDEF
jgi:hypothetical protein